jgi:hypothetical protein
MNFKDRDLSELRNEIAFEAAIADIKSPRHVHDRYFNPSDCITFGFKFADEFMTKAGLEQML